MISSSVQAQLDAFAEYLGDHLEGFDWTRYSVQDRAILSVSEMSVKRVCLYEKEPPKVDIAKYNEFDEVRRFVHAFDAATGSLKRCEACGRYADIEAETWVSQDDLHFCLACVQELELEVQE